jgi:hypothetical protein
MQEEKENSKKVKCRLPGCETIGTQRFGLCNKHRKWVERGNLDLNTLQVIKPLKRVSSYENQACKMPGCQRKPRRNFLCDRHSSMVVRGTLNQKLLITTHKRRRWPTPNGCYFCRKKDAPRYIRGFCPSCYNDHLKGYIDTYGYPMEKVKKRVQKYTDNDICKVDGCAEKARSVGFCHNHYGAFKYHSTFDIDGNRLIAEKTANKGHICKSSKCKKPAYCRLLCRRHYRKYLRERLKIEEIKLKASEIVDDFDPFAFD